MIGRLHREPTEETLSLCLWSHPAFQQQGCASAVLRDVMHDCFSLHAKRLCAYVERDNIASRRLFASLGFRVSGTEDECIEYSIFLAP